MAGLAVALGALAFAFPANHDVAWYLHLGGRILDGARPYVDFVEINPPPVLGFETAVVWLARVVHLRPLLLQRAVTVLVGLGSAAAVLRLLRGHLDSARLALLGCAVLTVVLGLSGYSMDQRDPLGVALLLPYLTALGLGGPVGPAVAAAAGAAVALKVQLVLVVGAAELAAWRAPKRHLLVLGGVLGALAAASLLVAPAYLPRALQLAPAYATYFHVGRENLALDAPLLIAASAATLAILIARGGRRRADARSETGGVARVYAVAAFGAIASFLVQAKGFSYQFETVKALAALAIAAALIVTVRRVGKAAVPLAGVLGLLVGWFALGRARTMIRSPLFERPGLERALSRYGPGARILGLNWALPAAFPLVNELGLRWLSPSSSLWVIDGARVAGRRDLVAASERRLLAAARDAPDVILLDTARSVTVPRTHVLTVLSDVPAFDSLLARYRVARTVGRYQILVPRRARPVPDSKPP